MYIAHYNFNEKPFAPSPDPRYLWFGDRQLGLYTSLEAAILQGSGAIVLTGDVGTGKTTFIRSLEAGLRQKTVFANISDPALEELEFYKMIAHGLGMDRTFNSQGEFTRYMKAVARHAEKKRKRVVIAVDESQRIKFALLKKIWYLANVEPEMAPSITWIIVGQGELLNHFRGEGRELFRAGRVTQFQIHPLDRAETGTYIQYRLKRAGSQQAIFSSAAIDRIFYHTAGHPRLINSICDLALLHGYADETRTIDSNIIEACATKVCLTHQCNEEDVPQKSSLKATAWLVASVLCLSMSGVLTYRLKQSHQQMKTVRVAGGQAQHAQFDSDIKATLLNVNLQTTNGSPFLMKELSPGMPMEGAYLKPLDGDVTNESTDVIKDVEPKQVVSPQKADATANGNFSFNKLASEEKTLPGTALSSPATGDRKPTISPGKRSQIPEDDEHDEEPDPSGIIEWLLEN